MVVRELRTLQQDRTRELTRLKARLLKLSVECALLTVLWTIPLVTRATTFDIAPPESGAHVRDLADLITVDDEAVINEWCAALNLEHTVPFAVVTIESMARYGADDMHVETFARSLFEQWGNDPVFNATDDWRRGVLLLISKGDRKARIELGGAWPPDYIARCVGIMNAVIVPQFKQGNSSQGAVAGVEAIVEMVRGDMPATPTAEPQAEEVQDASVPDDSAAVAMPDNTSATNAPPSQAMQIHVPSNTPRPLRTIPYPTQQVYYERETSRQPIAFGFGIFFVVALMIVKAIGGGLGGSGYSGGSEYFSNRHHHHHHFSGGGYLDARHTVGDSSGGHHHGGARSGGHHHGGGFSGISHGGGNHGGGSHGGGGGATGSW